jgi:phthiocerol/phenolphthiocerol synthesis type-I polyketide synthase E
VIVVSGMAGALVGPLPWPIATLPGFVELEAVGPGWMPSLVEAALTDAGYRADELAWRPIGVYRAGDGAEACRLAQRWDWCGPALGVDAECASGLVALLLAAQDLEAGHCDIAVVAAENLAIGEQQWDEGCAPLAAEAREGAPRAGAAVLVLERSDDARQMRAQIAGGAHRRLGAPAGMVGLSLRGITELLRYGLVRASLSPADVGYVELHALGSAVGDAVELAAFRKVWEGCPSDRPTVLGSHKARFGHLEATGGLVSLARIVSWFDGPILPPTAWVLPFSRLSTLSPAFTLEPGSNQADLRAGGSLALSRSGVGAIVLMKRC